MNEIRPISKEISVLYRIGMSYFDTQLSQYNIGSGQHFFLLDIYTNSGLGQHELRARNLFDKSTITRALLKLEEKGYITRIVDEQDKRNLRLYVTEKAMPVIEATKQAISQWHEILTSNMTEEEEEQLELLLGKMTENAEKAKKQF